MEIFSSRDVARHFDVSLHNVVAVVDRLGLGRRMGRNRVVRSEDLHAIEIGLRGAGYLKRPVERPVITVAMMFEGLRSADPETRLPAGFLLGKSLAAGLRLAGEDETDIEYLLAPPLIDFLERAVKGEAAAVDSLERLITNDTAAAFRPKTVEEPSDLPRNQEA